MLKEPRKLLPRGSLNFVYGRHEHTARSEGLGYFSSTQSRPT